MKLLLAIDPPEVSDVAIEEVARRPWPANTSVEVLSVVEPFHVWDVPTLVDGLNDAAKDAAQSAVDRLRSAGLNASPCVMVGHAKPVIVDRAREIGADFVIVGSRGVKGMERILLGSVAAAVARHAHSSVEIVRGQSSGTTKPRAMKILLATDGSECSQRAARSVAERPWPSGTTVQVMSAAELHIPLLSMPYFSASAMEGLRADAIERAEKAEMAAEEILSAAGLDESGAVSIPSASPQELIIQTAVQWGANLIVCGSHGRQGAGRFLLGSVSEAVATHAPCSVEIIR